jgi:hypothetical protein
MQRTLQALKLVHTLKTGYLDAGRTALLAADAPGVVSILRQAYELHPIDLDVPRALVEVAREMHPDLLRVLAPALEAKPKVHPLFGARVELHDPTLRFVLAVLLLAPTRVQVLAMVAARVPGSPEDVVLHSVSVLMGYAEPGTGLEEHKLLTTEPRLVAFRSMLDGKPDDVVAAEVAEWFDGADVLDARGVGALRAELRGSVLLQSLVTESA